MSSLGKHCRISSKNADLYFYPDTRLNNSNKAYVINNRPFKITYMLSCDDNMLFTMQYNVKRQFPYEIACIENLI